MKSKLIVKTEKTKHLETQRNTQWNPFLKTCSKICPTTPSFWVWGLEFFDGFKGFHIIDHYFIIMEQKSFWVFKFSLPLCVWYSGGLCVFPVFASSMCLERHCVCRRFLQREYVFRCGHKTGLLYTSKKIQKTGAPTPPNPPVRNRHHTGIIRYLITFHTMWFLYSPCTKRRAFCEIIPKKKPLTKMLVFLVFLGMVGKM